jgi:hypothetical protein
MTRATFQTACFVLLGLAAAATPLRAQTPPPAATPCNAVKGLEVVCGQDAPEDLVVLPGNQWVVASAYAGAGGINLIRVSDRTSMRAYPSPNAKNRFNEKIYAGCPGPPDASGAMFQTHGLWLQPGRGTMHRLYAVGHGSRESIEVFDVDTSGSTPVLIWLGCAIAPNPIGLNAVRGLPDGGFIASNFLARGISAEARQRMLDGEKNGELWEWHPTSGWKKVPGSEASGANGLEMSNDSKMLYVAAWGSRSFFTLTRGTGTPARKEIPLGFRIDNIRFAQDGSLLATGQGQNSTEIVKIDPKTLKVTKVLHRPDDASFRGGTVAVEIGDRLWVGSYQGDRIAILAAK